MATFQERFKEALGPRGYESCMRRSVQTVILYEAYRCIGTKLLTLRPFQRKIALWDQAVALVKQSDLLPHQREEVLWRTGTSKALLDSDTAWKRLKVSEKELDKLVNEKVKPIYKIGQTHEELCKEFIQKQFEAQTGVTGKEYPLNWEHTHNNVIMAFKMYYDGIHLDPSFPSPQPVIEINVPHEKPVDNTLTLPGPEAIRRGTNTSTPVPPPTAGVPGAASASRINSYGKEEEESGAERRQILQEVKEHMEILDMFHGIVHNDVLKKRKRDLFESLPPAPPSAARRRMGGGSIFY
eukprot:scaffold3211_cov120-Cylindrotheca_fusiformis.AAC.6